jgi:hypothetical protein
MDATKITASTSVTTAAMTALTRIPARIKLERNTTKTVVITIETASAMKRILTTARAIKTTV